MACRAWKAVAGGGGGGGGGGCFSLFPLSSPSCSPSSLCPIWPPLLHTTSVSLLFPYLCPPPHTHLNIRNHAGRVARVHALGLVLGDHLAAALVLASRCLVAVQAAAQSARRRAACGATEDTVLAVVAASSASTTTTTTTTTSSNCHCGLSLGRRHCCYPFRSGGGQNRRPGALVGYHARRVRALLALGAKPGHHAAAAHALAARSLVAPELVGSLGSSHIQNKEANG